MGCVNGVGISKAAGVNTTLRQSFTGSVSVRNDLSESIKIRFAEPNLLGSTLLHAEVAAGDVYVFDPGESWNFDFHMTLNENKLRSHIVRGGSYAVQKVEDTWRMETLSRPERVRSDKLSNLKGLSFSFSASGWLVVYQLGAAECLQNHGLVKNPYARVSGASGGALTACLLMYGADVRKVVDILLECAARLHRQPEKAFLLRKFVLQAMQEVIRDGSYQHPVFETHRLEIGVSSTKSDGVGSFAKMVLTGKEHRLKDFSNSADIAIALLASSTCGISGLPFKFHDEEGNEQEVADGAFKNFLPKIDEFSITVKPFSDGVDIFKVTGTKADVGPSEYVPMSFGIFPPPRTLLDHLYELGYRDMDSWLQSHLEERISHLNSDQEDLPSTDFTCTNNGMLWHKEVLQRVPVKWADMLSKNFLSDNAAKVLKEGPLEISSFRPLAGGDARSQEVAVKRWVTLTEIDLQWREDSDTKTSLEEESWISGLQAAGELKALLRLKGGKIHLSWIQRAFVDDKCNKCSEDMPERHFVINTVNYSLVLTAPNHADAATWVNAMGQATKEFTTPDATLMDKE
ncbi:Patatin-like phospholipase domain-containing protein 4 (Protein GS2) [Durusdinium trenchii]|uniref:Patatin-like phospholipase domain-containing protein 4 (Protein GS2) n=1 Tax=Durusdinium trenchii TaxID=1381693 RepID=A0ABP0NEA0_9DINO